MASLFNLRSLALYLVSHEVFYYIRQAADLNRGLGASATQQAVVQSFLKNFDQVI